MGDVIRKVDLWGLSEGGELRGRALAVTAIVDTGATRTVMGRDLGLRLAASFIRRETIEGRPVPVMLALVRLHATGCEPRALLVAVDDALASRGGTDRRGQPVEVILGHDYLEAEAAAVRYGKRGDQVLCKSDRLRPRKAKRKA